MNKVEKLIPADRNRCQTIWEGGSFMMLGPRPVMRCDQKPNYIVMERRKPHGTMSLCTEHYKAAREKFGYSFKVEEVLP